MRKDLDVQVDGGVTLDNCADVILAGANVIVAGTLLFNSTDPKDTISRMRLI